MCRVPRCRVATTRWRPRWSPAARAGHGAGPRRKGPARADAERAVDRQQHARLDVPTYPGPEGTRVARLAMAVVNSAAAGVIAAASGSPKARATVQYIDVSNPQATTEVIATSARSPRRVRTPSPARNDSAMRSTRAAKRSGNGPRRGAAIARAMSANEEENHTGEGHGKDGGGHQGNMSQLGIEPDHGRRPPTKRSMVTPSKSRSTAMVASAAVLRTS